MKFETLFRIMDKNKVDGMVITSDYNRFYLSGFTGTTATLFITKESKIFFTDFRYLQQAATQCPDFEIVNIAESPMFETINQICDDQNLQTIGFEGSDVVYSQFLIFEEHIYRPLVSVDLIALRAIKSPEEIIVMKEAIRIAEEAYQYLLKEVKVGMKEIEVEQMLVAKMKALGAKSESFTTIVASGYRGAMPHGVASNKVIEANEMVTVDFGAYYNGYASDITRNFATGHDLPKEMIEIYNIVLKAQQTAMKAIKPGMRCSDIDKIARDVIDEAGYGSNFGHSLGHGLGVLVHEYPNFAPTCDIILEPGMVLTVEPGIYVEGLGGVRIEDDVLVTEAGYEVLTTLSRELSII